MTKQPRAFAIMDYERTNYYSHEEHAFKPLPDPDDDQVTMPADAWIGYWDESLAKRSEARELDATAQLVEIGQDEM